MAERRVNQLSNEQNPTDTADPLISDAITDDDNDEDFVTEEDDTNDDDDLEETEEGGDDEYHDASDYIEVEVEEQDGVEGQDDDTAEATHLFDAGGNPILRLLLSRTQFGRLFMQDIQDAEDEEVVFGGHMRRRQRRRASPDPNRFHKVPSDKGTALMVSGDFGSNATEDTDSRSPRKRLAQRLLDRELGMDGGAKQKANQRLMSQGLIPATAADTIIHYNSPVYSGQFSDDGNFFFACVKDLKVRMYDTSNPYKWRYYKTVKFPFGSWTLTDASLSPDNRYLAYTSIQSQVCLAPTDPNDTGDPYSLEFSDSRHDQFGIWSIRFSGDGRELVAGTNEYSICVHDIEARRTVLNVRGHSDDVNAVCFGDTSSPHILYSGSDDSTLKVWDRRSMRDNREAGAFVGHTEGITYIDSKGDGRYILSNAKDQTMKLWDLRMVMSTAEFASVDTRSYSSGFDYRWNTYNTDDWIPHPNDNSVVTFRGHRVLRTLIRCHFSPPNSTNSRYVYSGSQDGKVYVYNMDATLAGKIDVYEATKDTRANDPELQSDWGGRQGSWQTCVRDASWHPNAPVLAASAWNGYGHSTGTVSVHSWNDGASDDEAEPRMGINLNERLDEGPIDDRTWSARRNLRSRRHID